VQKKEGDGMNKLSLKPTVKINGRHFDQEIRAMLDAARNSSPALSDSCVWCTSANDSTHMPGSKHYSNEAFDIRTKNAIGGLDVIKQWAKNIQIELGSDYDVVIEKDHLHLEFDPKV